MKQVSDITIKLLGIEISSNKVRNKRLKEIIRTRVHDGEKFLFNYGDHRDYKYSDTDKHSEHKEYSDHVDHKDRHKDTHRDGQSHKDLGGGGYYTSDGDYCDGRDHRDGGYSQHIDQNK